MTKKSSGDSKSLVQQGTRNLPAIRDPGSEVANDPHADMALDIRSLGGTDESELDNLYKTTGVNKGLRLGLWTVCLLLGSFFIWAANAELDEVATATGEIIPLGETKIVQHLEGGIIEEIFVGEGSRVKLGDSLVRLNVSATSANKDELESHLEGLLLLRARLDAEARSLETPNFPPELVVKRPDLTEAELANFKARTLEKAGRLRILDQRILQRELEIKEYEATETTLGKDIALMSEKLAISDDLLKQGNVSRYQHVQTQAEYESLVGRIAVLKQSVPRAEAALSQAKEERADEDGSFRIRALDELARVEREIGAAKERLSRATEQATRALIRSPIGGFIKDIRFKTIGGVVRPGEPMMEIVPDEERLVVQAKLQPIDRGYVENFQKAEVKISTYDYARYGGLTGQVERISATTTTDQSQYTYFEVIVSTEKSFLGDEPGIYPITPGMQAIVDIHTGTRTVLDFLIRPVLKLRHEAFRER